MFFQELFALIPFWKYALSRARSVHAVRKGEETWKMAFLCLHPCPKFPTLDPFFCQNPIWLLLAHLARERMDKPQGCGHHLCLPWCPLVPARLVAPGGVAVPRAPPEPSTQQCFAPGMWLGLSLLWKGKSLLVSLLATGIPAQGGHGECQGTNPGGKAWKALSCPSPSLSCWGVRPHSWWRWTVPMGCSAPPNHWPVGHLWHQPLPAPTGRSRPRGHQPNAAVTEPPG